MALMKQALWALLSGIERYWRVLSRSNGLSRSLGSVAQVMISRKHKDISRRLMLDGARGMPSGRKSAGTYVSFACGGRFGAREDSKLHRLMGACIRNCYNSKEFRVRKRQYLTNRCHGRPKDDQRDAGKRPSKRLGGRSFAPFPMAESAHYRSG